MDVVGVTAELTVDVASDGLWVRVIKSHAVYNPTAGFFLGAAKIEWLPFLAIDVSLPFSGRHVIKNSDTSI